MASTIINVPRRTLSLISAFWASSFFKNRAVIVITLRSPLTFGSPPAPIALDNVDVLFGGRVICHYDGFASGLKFYGYVGSKRGELDAHDALVPGKIVIGKGSGAGGALTWEQVQNSSFLKLTDEPFVSVVPGVWEITYVSTIYVETNFMSTNATISLEKELYELSDYGAKVFDEAKVGGDDWSLVIWCPNVDPNVMDSVVVRLQLNDGSTWEATVPLTVQ